MSTWTQSTMAWGKVSSLRKQVWPPGAYPWDFLLLFFFFWMEINISREWILLSWEDTSKNIDLRNYMWREKKKKAFKHGITSVLKSSSHWNKYHRSDTWCQEYATHQILNTANQNPKRLPGASDKTHQSIPCSSRASKPSPQGQLTSCPVTLSSHF